MPPPGTMAGHEKRRFVKADPLDLYMLTAIRQNILPGPVGGDGYIVVSIEGLKARIAESYTRVVAAGGAEPDKAAQGRACAGRAL